MPSFERPTPQQIDAAVQRMRSPEFAAYFLSRLQNPLWVSPLKEKGLFTSPPPPIPVDGGRVTFPHWPASNYLARMAEHVPSEVAMIFAELRTDNVFVIGDTITAALAMPADVAATLVPAVSRAADDGKLWIHFENAGRLCSRLAEGGQVQAAMILAESLFAPQFEQGQEQPRNVDEYWYATALGQVIPTLIARKPIEFLPRLCQWLKLAVEAKGHVHAETGRDYSYWWRPAIEEHGQNLQHDFASEMVGFVRAGFEETIRDGALPLDDALGIVACYRYLVFRRIRIHLISEFADQNPELARRIMLDPQLFDDFQYKHEYAKLVGQRLDLLTVRERETWFAWVDAGPDMADFDESFRERMGREATVEDRRNRREYWRFEKLHCVRKHLDGDRRAFHEAMLAKHGEPELAEFNSYVTRGAWGPVSPMTVADLTALTFAEAVERVSSWQPGEERRFTGPDTEGLAGTFGEYVATSPEAFSREGAELIGRPAIYVRAFMTQMVEAVKAGRDVDVLAVLRLIRWVLTRPTGQRTIPEQSTGALVDRDWQWTRDEISRFVQNVCEAKASGVPRYPLEGLREGIWSVLDVLCRDTAQSHIVHDTSKDDPRVEDYLNLGINSPRGKAVEAGLEYARWTANHVKTLDGAREVIPGGFDTMPEVREMLEWQIATGNRTLEALAIIGSRIGLVYWIDRAWLAATGARLFDLRGIEKTPPSAQGWAAWNAFLIWVRPHFDFYRLFREQFAYGVKQSTRVTAVETSREGPMNHLGEHLMILYARGQLGLDDDDGLLRRFLSGSRPDIRRYAIEFVGRILQNENLPAEMVERLMILWDVYWAGEGKRDVQQKPEAWLFGMWFASGQLPDQWALDRLDSLMDVTPTPEPDHAIVERLAKIVSVDVVRVARILDRIVRGDREGWRIQGWLSSARHILEVAMKAGGDARRQAEITIDYLGRRGHTGFGELLDFGDTAN